VHGVLLRTWLVAMLGAIPFIGGFIGIVDAVMIFREDSAHAARSHRRPRT